MSRVRIITLSIVVGVIGFVAACAETPVEPDLKSTSEGPLALDQPPILADLLTRGLAIALQQDELRRQLLNDLRDSPFPSHSLHLSSYLRGGGRDILSAIRVALGDEARWLVRGLANAGNLGLVVSPPEQRITWEGDGNFAVLPLSEEPPGDNGAIAYQPGGVETRVGVYARIARPVFLVGRSRFDFGTDPENQRASAPEQSRSTISTREEEFGVLAAGQGFSVGGGPATPMALRLGTTTDPCVLKPSLAGCKGTPVTLPTSQPGYHVAGTERCFVPMVYLGHPSDRDRDFLYDDCEQRLAAAMAPALLINAFDEAPTFEPYYAVRIDGRSKTGARMVKVFYAVAYHKDTGAFGHNGDSEYVSVWASDEGNGYWSRELVHTAAHVGSPAASSRLWAGRVENIVPAPINIRLYPAYEISRRLAPRVWVARTKHANYGSFADCNDGGDFLDIGIGNDTCTGNVRVQEFVVYSDGNLGREAYHDPPMRNCTQSRLPRIYGRECFWETTNFSGWHGIPPGRNGTTPYVNHLRSNGFN